MKKIISLLLATIFVSADPLPTIVDDMPLPITLREKQPTHFKYFSFGGCGLFLPIFPEIAFGCRKANSHHVWDVQAGASVTLRYFWGQASYLYYFLPNQGTYNTPYLGIGLTISHVGNSFNKVPMLYQPKYAVLPNLPITVGYQWSKNDQNQFLQLQVTPFAITTFSYGVGF